MRKGSEREARVDDRISELPDGILCHILSLLDDLKAAARTSILSTRWKNIWVSIPRLKFSEWMLKPNNFAMIVDRVLSLHESSGSDIKEFILLMGYSGVPVTDISHVNGWIQTAIRHNVENLNLELDGAFRMFELHDSVFICKTLKALKLWSNFTTTKFPTSGCFPNLKLLNVKVDFPDSDSMILDKLFSQCPVLEDLSISGSVADTALLNFDISAPELKRLEIELWGLLNRNPYKISISAPKLEYLIVGETVCSLCFVENTNSILDVNIVLTNHTGDEYDQVLNPYASTLLAAVSSTKFLKLAGHLLHASCVPALPNLKKLELVLHDCNNWRLLFELLKKSPNLQKLVLEYNDYSHATIPFNMNQWQKHVWKKTELVPFCLVSHLKSITIVDLKGRKDEMEAAKYLLKNGKVLQKMKIFTDYIRSGKKMKLLKKFCMFERGSETCKVQFF